jgi:hypothetical protein
LQFCDVSAGCRLFLCRWLFCGRLFFPGRWFFSSRHFRLHTVSGAWLLLLATTGNENQAKGEKGNQ